MGYTTIDVGNIFKSLFRIYKTTKLLLQYHIFLHMFLEKTLNRHHNFYNFLQSNCLSDVTDVQ